MLLKDPTNANNILATDNLADNSVIDISYVKNTLVSAGGNKTFTISAKEDEITMEVILNTASATIYTFICPGAQVLCRYEGVSTGTSSMTLSGAIGDKYLLCIKKVNSTVYVVGVKFLH